MTHPLSYLESAIAQFKKGCTSDYLQTPEPQLSDEILGGLVALYCNKSLRRLKTLFRAALDDSKYEYLTENLDYWEVHEEDDPYGENEDEEE